MKPARRPPGPSILGAASGQSLVVWAIALGGLPWPTKSSGLGQAPACRRTTEYDRPPHVLPEALTCPT